MAREAWSEWPFQEVIDFQEGPGILAKDFQEDGVPLVRLSGLEGRGSVLKGCNYLDPKAVSTRWAHFALAQGDVLLSTSASLGRIAVVGEDAVGAIPYTGIIRMRPRDKRLQATFIRYLLEGPDFQQQAEMVGVGSVIRHFGPMHLRQMSVRLPPPTEQRAITDILGTLDDKIELNQRMSETLEAIARALFKSWFVDFDPVRAKVEGRDTGLPKPLADLFPDSFEDSELGEIPKGWSATPLYDIATYINGAAYAAFQPNDKRRGLAIIKIAELKAGVTAQTKFSDVQMPEKYRIARGDILFSWSGNPDTSIDTFVWSHDPAWLNQHIFRVVPHHQHERSFVLSTLKTLRPVFAEIARNKQTTGLGHVTAEDLKRLLVARADDPVMQAWNAVAAPLHGRAFQNGLEIHHLSTLRDTLLPKLISGELRVKDAERIASWATA